jgi:hypothetical protein
MGFESIAIAVMTLKQNSAKRFFTQFQNRMITTACGEYWDNAARDDDWLLVDEQEHFAHTTACSAPMKKATFVAMDGLKAVC